MLALRTICLLSFACLFSIVSAEWPESLSNLTLLQNINTTRIRSPNLRKYQLALEKFKVPIPTRSARITRQECSPDPSIDFQELCTQIDCAIQLCETIASYDGLRMVLGLYLKYLYIIAANIACITPDLANQLLMAISELFAELDRIITCGESKLDIVDGILSELTIFIHIIYTIATIICGLVSG